MNQGITKGSHNAEREISQKPYLPEPDQFENNHINQKEKKCIQDQRNKSPHLDQHRSFFQDQCV